MSSESENSTVPATTTPSITPYREFVLSTIATTMDDSLRSQLLSSETTLYDFTKQVHALGEGKDFINTLRFNIPADALPSLAQNLIEASHNTLDRIAAVAPGTHTYENTLNQMVLDDILCSPLQASLDFISDVSADKLVRDAANEGKDLLQAYAVEASARVDVYDSVNAFSITEEAKKLTGEKKRFLERVLRDFRRDGLHLPKDQLAQLVNIRKEMSSLAIKFHANVGEEDTKFTFTKQQLDGLSDDQLSALTKGETADTYIVTLKTPDYVPVMQYCAEPETRRVLEKAYNSRCIDTNTTIMEQLIVLRERQANILGFDTHAAYVLDIRMAKTPVTVKNFLETLNTRLQPLYEKDQAELLALKKEECAKTGREFDNILHPYDRSYYSRLYEASAFSIDHQKLKEYFPLDHAFKGMFKLYETMFSVEFERITQDTKSWHKDVEMYYVIDRAPGSGERDILGQFYTDMHPRQGKYSHAAVFPLVQGCVDATGEKQRITPISAIVCNFPAATAEKPSLISHSDLTTLLHEFGHCLHAMLSITELPRFAGTAVARDFVEAPSQMLENWCWQRESLAYLAKHYKTGESIPDELLTNLIKSRVALQGSFNKRQLVFGMVDQRLHTGKGTVDSNGVLTPWRPDTAKVYSDTMYDVMGFRATEGTNMIAAFGHLAGGYDATYYGYLWSEVFAADMFVSRFGKEGILNPVVGLEYRRKILQKGDSQDASEILADFLGREPNQNAFLLQKGLEIDV